MIKSFIYVSLGAGLLACSSVSVSSASGNNIKVEGETKENSNIDAMIDPYRDSMQVEMNEVIAHAEVDFIVERPCGNLNNWVADAAFVSQTKTVRMAIPIICLLNTGGIRATLNQGDITRADIFKIMPFDNELVWVKMPVSSIPKIEVYLKNSGGEPIANTQMVNGKLEINGLTAETKEFVIITSDYLFNGGDKMTFFKENLEVTFTGKLLRDALLEEAQIQGTLNNVTENRMGN
jgi:2',3'-cyclic-nucleotide 2'-phosphodiesterase (5'-nucleotidase family)